MKPITMVKGRWQHLCAMLHTTSVVCHATPESMDDLQVDYGTTQITNTTSIPIPKSQC